jgi:hypothetical protein
MRWSALLHIGVVAISFVFSMVRAWSHQKVDIPIHSLRKTKEFKFTISSIGSSRRHFLRSSAAFVAVMPFVKDYLVPTPAYATTSDENDIPRSTPLECDDECIQNRKRIIQERRAMMRQSQTTTRRQDMFELSQQRALLYNTTYQGSFCLPGIPCL